MGTSEDGKSLASPTPDSDIPEPVDEICEVLEKYNPMKLDYLDPVFNSYDGKEHPSDTANSRYSLSKALSRLYVDRIPPSLDEGGLRKLFSKYGSVLDLKIFRRSIRATRNGIVSFGSTAEASEALDQIHEAEPLFLRVFYSNKNDNDFPTEEDIRAEENYFKREKLLSEFQEDRGLSWSHLPPLKEGPSLSLQTLIKQEIQSSDPSWNEPIFRESDIGSYSLSSQGMFDRKSDYLRAQENDKNVQEMREDDDGDSSSNDEVHEIGSFFGEPIPFHKISNYIRPQKIIPQAPIKPMKRSIPPVNLPVGVSSEVFIRVFTNDSQIEMFAIKNPFVCKDIRSKLSVALLDYQSLQSLCDKESLVAVQQKHDKHWYRAERVSEQMFFLLDFGKYIHAEDVKHIAALPKGFHDEIPSQAIPVNFMDDYRFRLEGGKSFKELVLLFKNIKVRVQPMGLHRNGQILLRFEGAKAPLGGSDLLNYLLEEGFLYPLSPPLQLGVDYSPYNEVNETRMESSLRALPLNSKVFIVDFMDSTEEIIVLEMKSLSERNILQERLNKTIYFEPMDHSFIVANRILIYRCPVDQKFYRGRVLLSSSQRKKARIFLFDYGRLCIAYFDDLYVMDKEFLVVSPFAHVLTLESVDRYFIFDPEVYLKTRRLIPILSVPLRVINLCPKGINATLQHPNGQNINQVIQEKLLVNDSHLSGSLEGQGRYNSFNYDECLLSTLCTHPSDNLEVCLLHIDSPSEIFATPLHSLPLFKDFVRQLQALCSIHAEDSFYRPDINRVCLVRCSVDGSWCRGVNLDRDLNIYMADHGIIEKKEPNDIQMIDERLMNWPFLANHSIYKGFENINWEDDCHDITFLKELAYSKVPIRVVEVRECIYVIEIPSIHEEMTALLERITSEKL